MAEAALAFGSNLGDSTRMIETALGRLHETDGIRVTRASSLYRTPPWGIEDQPDFINACALVETSHSPETLLRICKVLENGLGRREAVRWGPRLIDIDLLWMAGETRSSETLTLPHPRISERAFVLVPLSEIAPDLDIAGKRLRTHVEGLPQADRQAITRIE